MLESRAHLPRGGVRACCSGLRRAGVFYVFPHGAPAYRVSAQVRSTASMIIFTYGSLTTRV